MKFAVSKWLYITWTNYVKCLLHGTRVWKARESERERERKKGKKTSVAERVQQCVCEQKQKEQKTLICQKKEREQKRGTEGGRPLIFLPRNPKHLKLPRTITPVKPQLTVKHPPRPPPRGLPTQHSLSKWNTWKDSNSKDLGSQNHWRRTLSVISDSALPPAEEQISPLKHSKKHTPDEHYLNWTLKWIL